VIVVDRRASHPGDRPRSWRPAARLSELGAPGWPRRRPGRTPRLADQRL